MGRRPASACSRSGASTTSAIDVSVMKHRTDRAPNAYRPLSSVPRILLAATAKGHGAGPGDRGFELPRPLDRCRFFTPIPSDDRLAAGQLADRPPGRGRCGAAQLAAVSGGRDADYGVLSRTGRGGGRGDRLPRTRSAAAPIDPGDRRVRRAADAADDRPQFTGAAGLSAAAGA